jgi:hypothetical protein
MGERSQYRHITGAGKLLTCTGLYPAACCLQVSAVGAGLLLGSALCIILPEGFEAAMEVSSSSSSSSSSSEQQQQQ